jgi:putative nucleotidyltransferase with HDIG domain
VTQHSVRQTARPTPSYEGVGRARQVLQEARAHDDAGRLADAGQGYAGAIEAATGEGDQSVLVEALRRLGVVRYRQGETEEARELFGRSHATALAGGDQIAAAEALNSLAVLALQQGEFDGARAALGDALRLGGGSAELRGRIEQNLGIIANIQGDLDAALTHYRRSLEALTACGDERGRAMVYNNLGLISADRQLWGQADRYYEQCLQAADALGDVYLRGLVLMNRTEVFLARRQFDSAKRHAEQALVVFDRLGALRHKSETYKILGIVYRETGRHVLAESRLKSAVQLAVDAGAVLEEAEASRELALLYLQLDRNQDTLKLLNASHRLFKRLDARRDLIDVAGKVTQLEGTYFAVVRDWGQSIESADSYTHGHCERVATFAVSVARSLGLAEEELTTIRLGAYLHDLGKVRVPHEILNKPGKLTHEEFELMKQHPVYGIEMLAGIEFPWDIKPIIRWHHEKSDGTGYPDGLREDQIPLSAQIIGIVDVYDALTTTRSYRPAMTKEQALVILRDSRHHWRGDVFEAFMKTLSTE